MATLEQVIQTYQQLAEEYDQQDRPRLRDQFLLLAAETAWQAGRKRDAERLRLRLLYFNPHHLLKPYPSYAAARESLDVQSFLQELGEKYPPNVAENLLRELWEHPATGIDRVDDDDVVALGEPPPPAPPDVPQTAPLIDISEPPSSQPFKVFPEREQPPPTKRKKRPAESASPPPTVLNRPAAPRKRPAQANAADPPPPTRATARPRPKPRVAPPPQLPPESKPKESTGRGFLPVLLCILLTLGAVAVAAHVLFEPFVGDVLSKALPLPIEKW